MTSLQLPTAGRELAEYTIRNAPLAPASAPPTFNRIAYAAVHVVADPLSDGDPGSDISIDWERTLAFREYLWTLGFGVAEAMDTAQRGMGLDWPAAQRLIAETAAAARQGGRLAAFGAGTEQLAPGPQVRLEEVLRAYEEQVEYIEGVGGRVILMASRALAATARGADDYRLVYDRLLEGVNQPVILHWLGDMFDPALAGYWGSRDIGAALETALAVIAAHPDKVDGIKISLLSKEREVEMRRRLPPGVRMYTGDDFNYAEVIAGDEAGHSDALLGIFDAIAPAASVALGKLAGGDKAAFQDVLGPTVPLSRHIFSPPTRFYKTGVVFLAWLNGFQDHFIMLGGQQSARSMQHFAELFRRADAARVLRDPELAVHRMRHLLAVGGLA